MNIYRNNRLVKKTTFSSLIVISLLVSACSREPENPVDTVYFGGDILTMAGEQPQYVEAIAVDDGKISFIGSKLDADKLVGKETKQIDLHGATLIPKIVSGTQQILTSQGVSNTPNCWKETSFKTSADLIAALKIAQMERAKLGLGLFCMGYVPNTNSPSGALTEQELDEVFPETQVILVDASLQGVLTNSIGKKKFSLDGYKSLKIAIQKSGIKSAGLAVGQSADFMLVDKNPLKNPTASLASIQITQTVVNGKSVDDAPKDLAMLAILDIFAAYAEEKAAEAKIESMHTADAAKAAENAAAARKLADSKAAKIKAQADAKAKAQTEVKAKKPAAPAIAKKTIDEKPTTQKKVTYSKGDRQVKEVEVAPVAEVMPKPRAARFNMTQDGKKMTADDFDAWMKAQGIRIVPAKTPTETAPDQPTNKDGEK